ncbi:MAG: metallophosphatase [Bacteroidota bacterium]|nr:metallophosphatase [Bacteroidota bacterium]
MKRRNFIKNSLYSSLILSGGPITFNSCIDSTEKKITILHTNDVHSHIEPFSSSHSKFPNKGGVARRSTIIESIRNQNPNTLLFDAGDIFQGTPYFNFYGGEVEFKLMSMLNYDAATIGNHDFDNGIDGLFAQLPNAKFSFISSNYDFKNTIMDTHAKKYKIFNKSDIKIGVFGLGIELEGLVTQKLFKETKYLDPIEISQEMTRILKEKEKCDLIICLSHLGHFYKDAPSKICDVSLAKSTKDIDLIIGGHTHTFLEKPVIVDNIKGEKVIINQVGCWGLFLGQIDFYFDSKKNKTSNAYAIQI